MEKIFCVDDYSRASRRLRAIRIGSGRLVNADFLVHLLIGITFLLSGLVTEGFRYQFCHLFNAATLLNFYF